MGDGSEQEYTAAARSRDDWEEITRLRKLLNEARVDTERLDIAQELLITTSRFGVYQTIVGLLLPDGVEPLADLRALLDAVRARRDGAR